MTLPTVPTRIQPWQQELVLGIETTPGTAVTTGLYREVCRSVDSAPVRDIETVMGYANFPHDEWGSEDFQRHEEFSYQCDMRNGGITAVDTLIMPGFGAAGSEAVSGVADPYTHTGTPRVDGCNVATKTLYINTGDASNVKQITYATNSQVDFQAGPSGGVVAGVSGIGRFRNFVNRSVYSAGISNYVGSTAAYKKTRQKGNAGVYTFYAADGSTVAAGTILSFNLTLSRQLGIVPNPNGTDPLDIVPGPLKVAGSMTFKFNGAGANTLFRNASDYAEQGDVSHVHSVVFTDSDSPAHSLTFNFWPIKLGDVPLEYGDTYVVGSASFITFQDMAQGNQASPVFTPLKNVIITNAVSTIMTVS